MLIGVIQTLRLWNSMPQRNLYSPLRARLPHMLVILVIAFLRPTLNYHAPHAHFTSETFGAPLRFLKPYSTPVQMTFGEVSA